MYACFVSKNKEEAYQKIILYNSTNSSNSRNDEQNYKLNNWFI